MIDSEGAENASEISDPTDADIADIAAVLADRAPDMFGLADAASEMLGLADAASLMRDLAPFLPPQQDNKSVCAPSASMSAPGPSGSQLSPSQEVVEAMLTGRQ